MAKETIDALVEGGQADGGPPLGPALGPLGVNIGEVVSKINEKTSNYSGMTVPVEVIVDDETGEFEVEVGSPPTTAMIKNELGLEKGSSSKEDAPVADLSISQLVKIAESKKDSILAKNKKKAVKEVLGACLSMGVYAEGKDPREVQLEIDEGKYDDQLEDDEQW
ncbi:MAG: 50S ribosomal protein L11 [Candidatus Hadarchaeota archaeon]